MRLIPGSLWGRIALGATGGLLVALVAVVLTTYEITLLRDRATLDDHLRREGDRTAEVLVDSLRGLAGGGGTIDPTALVDTLPSVLAERPGSSRHLTVIRFGDVVVSTALAPTRLDGLRAAGALPPAEPGTIRSREGVRSRALVVRLADGTGLVVETHGDDRVVTSGAWDATVRVTAAAAVAGLAGVVVLVVVTRRSTRTLRAVSEVVHRARAVDLSARVPEPSGHSETARLARDLNSMFDELAAARRSRDELVASASHELRTPLAAALGHLELVRTGVSPDPERSLARAEAELARLTRLVEDLLALARVGDPSWLALRVVGLDELLDDLTSRLDALDAADAVVERPPSVRLVCDPDRLLQALSNLVGNAVGHTPAGTTVRISAATADGWVAITVADDGPGIPEDIRDHLGTAFVRSAPTGTGLGLAVVHAIADAHKGRVDIRTGSDGTAVTVLVPLDPP